MTPKPTTFHILNYNFERKDLKITFHYRIEFSDREPLNFAENIVLPKAPRDISQEALTKFLDPLAIILGISYFKLYCPKEINTDIKLNFEQAEFWHKVYKKGLGEFLYRNRLNPDVIAKFPVSKTDSNPTDLKQTEDILLGIGGGKDSIVASVLLKDFSVTSFLVETQQKDLISERIILELGNQQLIIKRFLDPEIFKIHEGAHNGHIPISAVFAFLGLLSAALYGYKYVSVGNEHSSNFGNANYYDEIINHQWSKSIEFETMLQKYTRKFMTPNITYFSCLRQYYEIRVVEMFSKYKKYFPLFTSCNRNFRIFNRLNSHLGGGRTDSPEVEKTKWCGECPKCAYVFLMLSAFLDKSELLGIFHKDLFTESKLLPVFEDLLGFGTIKPFDCVGTFEEAQAALYLASNKFKDSIIIKTLLPRIKDPKSLIDQVFKTVPAPTLPTPFKFLGIKNIGILGYGKEGKTTEKYLKKFYPNFKISILDQSIDKNYLEKQTNFDLRIKTPGIPKNKITAPYTTATNIFFSRNKNFTIGVTGSKGKSTTTSLIYDILKTDNRKVRILGNIGNPVLEVFFDKIDPEEIFVIELSSYMLDDIEYSPNIAVLLNLFPEHMDYHDGVENYYKAKKNIFRFQKTGDIAIQAPFDEVIPLGNSEIPLIGEHNYQNIKAAIKVARILKVSDSSIKKAIRDFKPLPHRLEFIGIVKDIKFYDDAISTTPESAIMAIQTLKNVGTILLGGQDRGYDFSNLEKILREYKIKNIVLFPNSGKRILKSKQGFNIIETQSMKEAVDFAFEHTPKGQICLLSTASPSYSLWKNFEEKGTEFKKYVFAKNI